MSCTDDIPGEQRARRQDPQAGHVLRMDAGWNFLVGYDDRPQIVGGTDGMFARKAMPLFPVKLP